MEKKELKLDLACGQKKQPGFTGIDKTQVDGVDIIWDLERFPWPFEDNSVDEIICRHYVEHTPDMIAFMDEIHRILKPGRDCTIVAPYYTSIDAWRDPTHRRAISEESFRYFSKKWREEVRVNHYGIKADFMFTYEFMFTPEWKMRSEEARKFAVRHYHNVVSEIKVTLTKNFVIPKMEDHPNAGERSPEQNEK